MSIHVTSDLTIPTDAVLKWRIEDVFGEVFSSGERRLRVPALSDLLVEPINFTQQVTTQNQKKLVFVCELFDQDGCIISRTVIPFVPNKHLQLVDPGIKTDLRIEDNILMIKINSTSLARFVELALDGLDVIFSDNYFDLPANTTVEITCELPVQWNLEQAKGALIIRSLYDSFA
jgi:beta-mannosidase